MSAALVNEDRLREVIREEIAAVLSAAKPAAVEKQLLTLNEVSALLGLSRKTVAKFMREEGLLSAAARDAGGGAVRDGGKLVVYVAHPLSAATREGIEANRRNAARWVAFLALNFEIAPECSWIVLTGELEETPENRERGLAIDLALVERCDELWMVGGRVSSGMLLESTHALERGKHVVDLTGFGFPCPSGPEVVALELDGQGSEVFA